MQWAGTIDSSDDGRAYNFSAHCTRFCRESTNKLFAASERLIPGGVH